MAGLVAVQLKQKRQKNAAPKTERSSENEVDDDNKTSLDQNYIYHQAYLWSTQEVRFDFHFLSYNLIYFVLFHFML